MDMRMHIEFTRQLRASSARSFRRSAKRKKLQQTHRRKCSRDSSGACVTIVLCGSAGHFANECTADRLVRLVQTRSAAAAVGRRTFVRAAGGRELDAPLQRNKYQSVIEGDFRLVSGEVLPEVKIDWEQWVRVYLPARCVFGSREPVLCVC